MPLDSLIDVLSGGLGAVLVGRDKYFARSLETPTIAQTLHPLRVELPPLSRAGICEVPMNTLAGAMDPAFWVARWRGPGAPTLLYHHGSREQPFAQGRRSFNSFKRIFLDARPPLAANLIAIRAAFHTLPARAYVRRLGSLSAFVGLLSASVALIEALVAQCRALGSERIVVSGLSLGGFVTNLHRTHYNTADAYIPLLAGAALDQVFNASAYRNLTGPLALGQPQALHQALNFEDEFLRVTRANVFPLLALHDRIARYADQGRAYQGTALATLPKGHITAALAATSLRRHVLRHLTG